MSEAVRSDYRMTVDAFHAFLAGRPDWEKWELVDGEAIVQATPTKRHQAIIGNLLVELDRLKETTQASWYPLIGIGTRVSSDQHNEVVPDVMVLPEFGEGGANWTYELVAAFEVLSPGSVRRDMVRKREFYQRVPSLAEYVVLAQDRGEATVFSRSQAFAERRINTGGQIELPTLGGVLQLARIYRNLPLDT